MPDLRWKGGESMTREHAELPPTREHQIPIVVSGLSEPDWLAARRELITATDASVILGLNPWKSAFTLYHEKRGAAAIEPAEREAAQWGRLLEEPLRLAYADRTQREIGTLKSFALTRSETFPFAGATLDGFVEASLDELADGLSGPGVLECKTTSAFKAAEWASEPPVYYQVQVQHQLMVTGYQWASMAILIGGQKFRWLDVPRHEPFIEELVKAESEFWARVREGREPPTDGSQSTHDLLRLLYPTETVETRTLGPECIDIDVDFLAAKQQVKDAEYRVAELEHHLKAAIGDAAAGVLPNGVVYTLKTTRRKGYTVEPTEFRVLRRRKGASG
jgi:putative phage-type endonuclease